MKKITLLLHSFVFANLWWPLLCSLCYLLSSYRLDLDFFFPSFARFPSFIILLNWFCSHIHRYWSAHRHYASCCILAMNIFQVSQVASTFGIVFSVSSLVLYLLYSHVSLCLSKFSLWRKKKKKKGTDLFNTVTWVNWTSAPCKCFSWLTSSQHRYRCPLCKSLSLVP